MVRLRKLMCQRKEFYGILSRYDTIHECKLRQTDRQIPVDGKYRAYA